MSYFCIVHMPNHGLDARHVGAVCIYRNGKLILADHEDLLIRKYFNWTIIESIIDADNFKCWSGEPKIINLSHLVEKNSTDKIIEEQSLFIQIDDILKRYMVFPDDWESREALAFELEKFFKERVGEL